ncbi:MAG: succinate dehydrogenase, cytochrome b556 subunit [Gammaproteobacteria bacterium]
MANNPISPHLQVYRPQLTSVLSISHRISGVFLALGTVMILYWLVAASLGPAAYAEAQCCLAAAPTQLLLFGWTLAFFYHLCNGIRHLLWDTGWGFELETAYKTGYIVLAAAVVLTVLTWLCVLLQGGGA